MAVITITTLDTQQLLNYLKVDEQTKKPTYTIRTKVKFKHPVKTNNKQIETTLGRVIFNSLLLSYN